MPTNERKSFFRPFTRSKTSIKSASNLLTTTRLEFRVVFRAEGVATDPFITYTEQALHDALQLAIPAGTRGSLTPSVDSRGQPAALVRIAATDSRALYELRANVVSGDFMRELTRQLRANVKEVRRSQRVESMRTGAPTGLPDDDRDLDKLDDDSANGSAPGVTEMTMMDEDDNIWERIRLMLPWEEKSDKDRRNEVKRELNSCIQQRTEMRDRLAELEAKCTELTEQLATMSKSTEEPAAEVVAKRETIEAPPPPPPAAALSEDEVSDSSASSNAGDPVGPVAANHVALEELTPEQLQMVKDLSAAYIAAGGELDEYGDIFILRFLVDRDWKYEKAKKKAEATAAWRARSGVNGFRKQIAGGLAYHEIPNIKELFTSVAVANCHSRTRSGDLLTFIDYGSLDVTKFFKVLDNTQYFDINNFILEYASYHADKLTKETGILVRQFMVIDAGGIGLGHVSLRMFVRFKPIMPLADLYYPELLGGARVLNAAWALHQGWKLVKPLLSKQIQDMVGILDAKHTQGALLKVADPEAVPDYLGGECATIPRPAVDEYPRAGMDGVDADAICPGKKLGAYMRRTLAP